MTKTLILTRHAKSSWANPGLADHDRPLNKRGVKSARAVGKWLRKSGWHPDQSISSSSRRTRETFAEMRLADQAEFTDALYHAGAPQMRKVLQGATGQVVMMLGHNPGIGEFAEQLVSAPPGHSRFYDYPTCATLIVKFDIADWSELLWNTGEVVDFAIPRELPA